MTSLVLTANIAGGEHSLQFSTLIEARAYGKLLQKQPATISFEIKRAEPSGFILEKQWRRRGGRMQGMNVLRFENKLREAEFFYLKLSKQEKVTIGDRTPFGYYLSAFLTAAKSVREIFVFEQAQDRKNAVAYKSWRKGWDAKLTPQQKSLIDYMQDDRDKEVHTTGSQHTVGQEEADRLGVGTHRTPEGIITYEGAACVRYVALNSIFHDKGVAWPVAYGERAGRAEYLSPRRQMITEFQATFPETTTDNLYKETLRLIATQI